MALDMRSLRIGSREERGQSLVEVALLMPLLLLIVLGVVDVGRAFAVKSAATNAAREAALYAAREPQATADAICQRAMTALMNGPGVTACTLDPITAELWRSVTPQATVTCSRIPPPIGASSRPCSHYTAAPRLFQGGVTDSGEEDGTSGSTVTVTVRADVALISWYLVSRAFDVNPITVAGSATFGGLGQ
jgi:Flp pilus assembly protein TadG